MKMKYWGLESH